MYNNSTDILKKRRERNALADALAGTNKQKPIGYSPVDMSGSVDMDIDMGNPLDHVGSLLGAGGSALGKSTGIGGLGLIGNAFNGVRQGFDHDGEKDILGGVGNGVQGFFGVDGKDSDVKQSLKGAANGALAGTAIMPGIGTAIGALLGLGSSFLDDM